MRAGIWKHLLVGAVVAGGGVAAAIVGTQVSWSELTGGGRTALEIRQHPREPLIERTRFGQAINFDFELENVGDLGLELYAIRAAVRDPGGAIVQRLEVNDNGGEAGIRTVPHRLWKAGENHTIFNPFHTLADDVPIGRIDYELLFRRPDGQSLTKRLTVRPAAYRTKTKLLVPLPGRVLVWDGHDFYSHHRRWDFSNATIKALGIATNPGRYSLDLVVADSDGGFFKGSGGRREDYFSYGHPVVAPAAGRVVAAASHASNEPSEPTPESFRKAPMLAIYGNYVVIDHGNGEYSQIGHLKNGSVKVKAGDIVTAGQVIAAAGASGTSLFPHVHYQLATRPGLDGEGLPAYFEGVTRILGRQSRAEPLTAIDTGDIVETR